MIKRLSKSVHLFGLQDKPGFCCIIKRREIAPACPIATRLLLAGVIRQTMVLASRKRIFSIPPVSCRIHDLYFHYTFIVLIATGHSLLHELTHLDSLAKQAGLDAPDEGPDANRHGTDDAQSGRELLGARDHLKEYKKDNTVTRPDYNAESYAAAATGKFLERLQRLVTGGLQFL